MKKLIFLSIAMILILATCSSEPQTAPLQSFASVSNEEFVDEANISIEVKTPAEAGVTMLRGAGPPSQADALREGRVKNLRSPDVLPGSPGMSGAVTPGIYCHSTFSEGGMLNCKAAGGTGVFARWQWCQLMQTDGSYDFSRVEAWITRNANNGMRTGIGFQIKDLRNDALAGTGSCTATSDGVPSHLVSGIYNDDILGTPATPLVNPATISHFNFMDTQAQQKVDEYIAAIGDWLADFKAAYPGRYWYIEFIEVGFGEMDTGAHTGSNADYYADKEMYRCRFGGGVWTPDTGEPGNITHGSCSTPVSVHGPAASASWRDNFIVPMLREWSTVDPGNEKLKLITISNHLYSAYQEKAEACATCGGLNMVDWAYQYFDGNLGYHNSGGNVDQGNGNGRDIAGEEYTNSWNVLKMRWPGIVTSLEAGAGTIGDGPPNCCNTERELYWNALQAIDYGVSYWMMLPGDIYAYRNTYGVENGKLFWSQSAGYSGDYTDANRIGIWFRDTTGSYYPDGDNGTHNNPVRPRGPSPCCSWLPNYQYLIYQQAPAVNQVVGSTSLPTNYRSWWARTTTGTDPNLKFDIDAGWRPGQVDPQSQGGCGVYNLRVDFLDTGTGTWTFRYPNYIGNLVDLTVDKTNTGSWRTLSRVITDWDMRNHIDSTDNFWLMSNGDGNDIFHTVTIDRGGAPGCASTPTPPPTSPPNVETPTPPTPETPTPPGGGTSTPTPEPTEVPVCTPGPWERSGETPPIWADKATPTPPLAPTNSPTPARSPTRTPTVTPTWTPGGPTPTRTPTPFYTPTGSP